MSGPHNAESGAPAVWCPDYKAEVEHPAHWHVIRTGGITYAQGQCPGWTRDTSPEAGAAS